jgi:hypothetical protein
MITIYRYFRDILVLVFVALPTLVLLNCGGGGGGGGGGATPQGGGDTTAPAVVTGLSVSAVSSVQINLSWNASSDAVGVTGYKIYRSTGSGAAAYLKTATGTSTSDAGLSPNTQYCYKISACDAAANESMQCAQQCVTTPATKAFSGFDFTLATGNFWEYKWDFYDYSWAQGSSSTTTRDSGRFWIVLGSPTTIQGITAYPVQLYGKSRNTDKTFSPRWKYLAVDSSRMLGSTDGLTLTPFFDAQAGKWPGGGFFTTIGATTLSIGQIGTISTYNTYLTGTAIVAGRSSSQSECEYFPGVGSICGDSAYNYTENEYFRPNVGPVGYYYYNAYSYSGGGFSSGGTWRHNAGLTASSRSGQAYPLVNEIESNDSPATAQSISKTNPIIGVVSVSTTTNVGNTPITATVVPDSGGSVTITTLVEDWYKFTLVSAATVTITLSFEGDTTADLDVFLIDAAVTTLYGYSVHDNQAAPKDQNERIKISNLPAGDYRIGVDAFLSPSGAVTYTLQLE